MRKYPEPIACGGSCIVADARGVHTNGSCHCLEDLDRNHDKRRRVRDAFFWYCAELRALRARIAELEDPSKVDPDLFQMAMRIAAGHADASDAWALLEEVERLRGQVDELERLRKLVSEMGPSDD